MNVFLLFKEKTHPKKRMCFVKPIYYLIAFVFHLPRLKKIAVSTAPIIQEHKSEICMHSRLPLGRASVAVRYEIP
jgi:hypothetical protein